MQWPAATCCRPLFFPNSLTQAHLNKHTYKEGSRSSRFFILVSTSIRLSIAIRRGVLFPPAHVLLVLQLSL